MSENNINAIIDVTMDKLRTMVDADTILGTPVTVGDNTVIPISKVSFGLATGGTDFPSKSEKTSFGGGGGAGVTITPIGIIAMSSGNVKFIPVNNEVTTLDRALQALPEIIDKLKAIIDDATSSRKIPEIKDL